LLLPGIYGIINLVLPTKSGKKSKRSGEIKKTICLSLALLLFISGLANCRTITVRLDDTGDYTTIQAAIDDCNDGDVVIVAPGTYTGEGNRDIDFKGKAIIVRSKSGPEDCVIDCQGSREDLHRGF